MNDMEFSTLPPSMGAWDYLEIFDFEPELLVTRALTLQDNWKRKRPARVYKKQVISTSMRVSEMLILPGGKYLLASTSDPEGFRPSITVYSLEYNLNGTHAVAAISTKYQAYQLRARFLIYNGRPGIMIAYLERRLENDMACR